MAQIVGIEGMSPEQLVHELQNGARFVQYQFCFSVGIMTIKQGTNFYFVRAGESRAVKGLRWSLLTLLIGWWGIPWEPIFTVQSVWMNLRGGDDVTPLPANALRLPIDKSTLYPEEGRAARV